MPSDVAAPGWRTAAFAIDLLTLWLLVVVLSVVFGIEVPAGESDDPAVQQAFGDLVILGWAARALYDWLSNSIGWSPGKRILGLRIVTAEGAPPGPMGGFARMLGAQLSFLALGLGHLWAFWDRRRQGWHDKLAGTYVVRPSGEARGRRPPSS